MLARRAIFFLVLGMLVFRWGSPLIAQGTFRGWEALIETESLGQYQMDLEGVVTTGLEVRFYGVSGGGDNTRDFVKIECYDVQGKLAGLFRWGRDNDERDSVTGWHSLFLVLPQKTAVGKIVLSLFARDGYPRMVKHLSPVQFWNPLTELNFFPFSHEGRASWSGFEALPRGKVWLHAAGMGSQKASLDYAVWRSFELPVPPEGFSEIPDVVLDAAWAGTVNVVGDGFTGRGGYALALQAGIGQGFSILEAFSTGRAQCLEKAVSHSDEGFIMDLLSNSGSGILDIALDLTEATALGYFKFFLDSLGLVSTLFDIDVVSLGARRVVFEKVSLEQGKRIYAWLRFRGVVAALGLAHSVASFYGDGTVEGDLQGNRGIEIGGVLIHFQGPKTPEVLSVEVPAENGVSTRPRFTVNVSADIRSLDENRVVLRKAKTAEAVPLSFHHQGKTLTVEPRRTLDGESPYELTIEKGALWGLEGQNLAFFTFPFVTGTPFMVYESDPAEGTVRWPLAPIIRLWFNRMLQGPGERFSDVAIRDLSGRVVASPENVEFDSSSVELHFPRLEHATSYVLDIPDGAFMSKDGFPNLPFRLSFTTAPMTEVLETCPVQGEEDAPFPQYITVTFSDWVVPGENYESITLAREGVPIPFEKSSTEQVVYFRPLEPFSFGTHYTLTIPEGAFTNPETRAHSRAFTLSFTTAIPPEVVWTNPPESREGVFRDEPVIIAFSEPIKLYTVREETLFPETDGEKVSLTVSTFENLLILNPELPWPAFPPETRITIHIPPETVSDLKGTPNQVPFTLSFRTGKTGASPRVVWTIPGDGEEGISTDPSIVVSFDREIEKGPAWEEIALHTETGEEIPIERWVREDKSVELRPLEKLRRNRKYRVSLPPRCVQGRFEGLFTDTYIFTFQTELRPGPYEPE